MNRPPIIFDEEAHTYTRIDNGKLIPGVTTILAVKNKVWMAPWVAKEITKFLEGKRTLIAQSDGLGYNVLLKEAKNSWRKKSKDGADAGTAAHKIVETYIKNRLGELIVHDEPNTDEVRHCFEYFLKWVEQYKPKWLYSELAVASLKYEYAGTLDAIAEINGETTLIDFKTNNQIDENAFLQTAAYQLCLEEMGLPIKRRMIVRMPKTGEGECLEVQTPLEFDREVFLALRRVYAWTVYTKNRPYLTLSNKQLNPKEILELTQ